MTCFFFPCFLHSTTSNCYSHFSTMNMHNLGLIWLDFLRIKNNTESLLLSTKYKYVASIDTTILKKYFGTRQSVVIKFKTRAQKKVQKNVTWLRCYGVPLPRNVLKGRCCRWCGSRLCFSIHAPVNSVVSYNTELSANSCIWYGSTSQTVEK